MYIIRKDIEKDFRSRLFDRIAKNFNAEYVFQNPDSLFTSAQLAKISPERKKPWGTVHAVLCAEDAVKEPFAVINADDYYGREAFRTIHGHLAAQSEKSTEHAMVGYVLENTMSRSGSVSRGVCTVENGYLKSIKENTKISYKGNDIVTELEDGTFSLTGKEPVSMNLFGFTNAAFEVFHTYWDDFIAKNNGAEKAEALLPPLRAILFRRAREKSNFIRQTKDGSV